MFRDPYRFFLLAPAIVFCLLKIYQVQFASRGNDISAAAAPAYDTVGLSCVSTRQTDPCIADVLVTLLRLPPDSVIADIGAGTGNYTRALAERSFRIEAVEPSAVTRGQAVNHPCVRWHAGVAKRLPLADNAVQGCISTLSLHYFTDRNQAVREMQRITGNGPLVFLTFDYRQINLLWLADYFPKMWEAAVQFLPPLEETALEIKTST